MNCHGFFLFAQMLFGDGGRGAEATEGMISLAGES